MNYCLNSVKQHVENLSICLHGLQETIQGFCAWYEYFGIVLTRSVASCKTDSQHFARRTVDIGIEGFEWTYLVNNKRDARDQILIDWCLFSQDINIQTYLSFLPGHPNLFGFFVFESGTPFAFWSGVVARREYPYLCVRYRGWQIDWFVGTITRAITEKVNTRHCLLEPVAVVTVSN